jgi:predicted MFS family arabinose efflux permease
MPAFAADVFKARAGGYGALLSANGIGALIGALTVASMGERVSKRFLVFGGLWIFSAMLLLLAFVQNFFLAMVLLAVAGWGMMLFFSTTNTLLQISSSDEMRGRVMGIWALVFGGMMPVGGLEAGAFSKYFGIRWTVAIGAIVCALAAFVTWLIVRSRKTEQNESGH